MSKLSAEEKLFQTYFIYKITNNLNGKIYIGYSNNPQKRWHNHLKVAKGGPIKGKGQFYAIHAAISKYGKDNFALSIIDKAFDAYKICLFEKYWINYYQSNIKGYNLTSGGENLIGSENPFYGKKHTKETKELFSKQRKAEGRIRGHKNPKNKLTEDQVREIKLSKLPTKELVKQFNISRGIIQRIRAGKLWTEVKVQFPQTGGAYTNRKGENSSKAKLTWEMVKSIRQYFIDGQKIANLARQYNVSWTNIKSIIQNKIWVE